MIKKISVKKRNNLRSIIYSYNTIQLNKMLFLKYVFMLKSHKVNKHRVKM